MTTKLEEYIGEGYTIPVQLKVNDELLRYVQQAVLDLKYRNPQLYLRDLIYGHAKGSICQEFRRNPEGIPKESLQESLDNQGIPVNHSNQTELVGIPTETPVKQVELPQLASNSNDELPKSVNELSQLTGKSNDELPKSVNELLQLTGKSIDELDKSEVDMSQVEIIEDYVPKEISATQYRMYVRRLEYENAKLIDALKECYAVLEGKQKQGDLSAMLYQSELGIHQIISWAWSNFQQFFPNQDLRQTLTLSVRNFYPSFPFFKLPNQ